MEDDLGDVGVREPGLPDGVEIGVRQLAAVDHQLARQEQQGDLPAGAGRALACGAELFLDQVSLVSDVDSYERRDDRVSLMTVHSAKGLEFPVVFIVGLEEGLMPHSRSLDDPKQMEEERRLMYVAITRAERSLTITHAMRRRLYGNEVPSEPSPFLNEMPLELLSVVERVAAGLS